MTRLSKLALVFAALLAATDARAAERVLLLPPAALASAPSPAGPQGKAVTTLPSSIPANAKGAAPGSIDKLRARATREGKVRVIVGTRVPFAAEALLSTADGTQQRKEIAAAGAGLRTKFGGSGSIRTFSSVPFAAMSVNQAQLGQLLTDPNVISITDDPPMLPQLTYSVPLIGAPDAWKAGATGKDQVVAVIDHGTQTDHPFLRDPVTGKSKVVYEAVVEPVCTPVPNSRYPNCVLTAREGAGTAALPCSQSSCNSTDYYHGTAVSGIIAGQRPASAPLRLMENERGLFWPPFPVQGTKTGYELTGVAPDARLMVMRVYYTSDFVAALEKVYELRNKFNIAAVSTSLGVVNSVPGPCDATKASFAAAVANLRAAGIPTVASAGNFGEHYSGPNPDNWTGATNRLMAPACLSSAVSVGATLVGTTTGKAAGGTLRSFGTWSCTGYSQPIKADDVACFSDTSPQLTLLAPSFPTETSAKDGTYTLTFGGTSAAAPHVAGAIAVLRSGAPKATLEEILGALRATGKPVRDYRTGLVTPRIDVARALAYLQSGGQPSIAYTRTGNGSGTVAFSPSGSRVSCSESCTSIFANGATVTLSAQPANGMRFLGWNSADGECQGTSPSCTLTISKQVTLISAAFGSEAATASYRLSYARSGSGSGTVTAAVNGTALPCSTSACSTVQPDGTVVTLTAAAGSNSSFSGWSGACSGTSPTCSFALRADSSVAANFLPKPGGNGSLTALKMGPGTLSMTLNGTPVACTTLSCTASGAAGAVATVTATADATGIFAGWTGACTGLSPSCTVILAPGGKSALATFKPRSGSMASARQ